MKKYERYVITTPLKIVESKYHHGSVLNEILSSALLPECKVTIHTHWRTEKTISNESKPVAKFHTHDVDQIQLAIGEPGSSQIEIILDDETYKVQCPYAIYIPAGLKHAIVKHEIFKPPVATVMILFKGKYE